MQDNYIKGFVKTAAQPSAQAAATAAASPLVAANQVAQSKPPDHLFHLTLQDNRNNGKQFWDGSIIKINVPATETNKVFTDALKKPIKLSPKTFRTFTPVHPYILRHANLLSDTQVRNRVKLIQTGALRDPLVRANQGSAGSSSAYGVLQNGMTLTDPIPMPNLPKVQQDPYDGSLILGKIQDKGLANLISRGPIQPPRYPRFASPLVAAYVHGVLSAQRKAFLHFGRQPNKPGYQKRFDYSSYTDPAKGIGAQMVRSTRFRVLNDRLDANYMSYINSKAFNDYITALKNGATTQQARTAYFNSLAANWYGDYRNKPGAKQRDMRDYAYKLRNPNKQIARKARRRDKLDAWFRSKTNETPLVPPNVK